MVRFKCPFRSPVRLQWLDALPAGNIVKDARKCYSVRNRVTEQSHNSEAGLMQANGGRGPERMVPGTPDRWNEEFHVRRYRFAAQFASGRTVLDVACGAGYGASILLAASAEKYLGVDLSPEAVEFAKGHYSAGPRASFVVDDACHLSLVRDQSFDLVVSFETIEHVPYPELFLTAIRRVLRPDGTFIVSTPNRLCLSPGNSLSSKPENPFHLREWDQSEFIHLLTPQFRIRQLLGQRPKRQWKAQLRHIAAQKPWLGRVLARADGLRRVNPRPSNAQNDVCQEKHCAVQELRPGDAPLFTICIAQPR